MQFQEISWTMTGKRFDIVEVEDGVWQNDSAGIVEEQLVFFNFLTFRGVG